MGLLSIVSSFGTVSSVIIKAFDTNKALAKVLNKYLTKRFPPISFNSFCFGCIFCFAVGFCVCVVVFFLPCHTAGGILVSQLETEPMPPEMEALSLNCSTAREFSSFHS